MHGLHPYPWRALEHIPRSALGAIAAAREALDGDWARAAVERAASGILDAPVRIASVSLNAATVAPRPDGCACFVLQSPDAASRALVELEGALAARIVSGLLKRPCPIPDPRAPVPDSVQGAAAAIALLVARRLGSPLVLQSVADTCPAVGGDRAVRIDATVLVGDESFAMRVVVVPAPRPTRCAHPFDTEVLARMGEVEIAVPMVVAIAQTPRQLLQSLRVSDVLVPAGRWLIERAGTGLRGRPVLCAPAASRALPLELIEAGQIVLGEGTMSLDAREQDGAQGSAADVIADAPVLVRIELGQVSMSARQWAQLRPGDVLASGRRVADRAVLRIAGHEVARGELVDIDGELGVRIHELVGQHNGEST